jgi:hypothetical protein
MSQFKLSFTRNEDFLTMTEPTQVPQATDPKMGFNTYAERLNGRAAMIGFIIAIAIEFVTRKGVLLWLGLI